MRDFESDFRSYAVVTLSLADFNRAQSFAIEATKRKANEEQHKKDGDVEVERWTTGRLGEMAVERFLGCDFTDWEVGHSDDFNVADLACIGVAAGIKTVKRGQYPVVFANPKNAEVIVVKDGLDFHICGLASKSVMSRYSDDNLILNAKLRAKGTKTGFYGFSELVEFRDLDELKRLSWQAAF